VAIAIAFSRVLFFIVWIVFVFQEMDLQIEVILFHLIFFSTEKLLLSSKDTLIVKIWRLRMLT